MRIICEQLHGHWSAWIESSPETAFGGDTAWTAIVRLVEATPGLELQNVSRDVEPSTNVRFSFLVDVVCPGSGRYVGLNEAGDCGTCGGSGRVHV